MNIIAEAQKVLVAQVICRFCEEMNFIVLDRRGYEHWQAGMHIRQAFPWMSAEERRLLVSGVDVDCVETLLDDWVAHREDVQ